jgi:hypothetical protein
LGQVQRTARVALRGFALAAGLAGAMGAAGAQELKEQAQAAALGDGVSTAVGLAVGAAELNPVGPILSFGMKAAVLHYVDTLPATEQPRAYAMAAASWSGATANNVCMTVSLLTGGSFIPACIALGVAWGVQTWNATEAERHFGERCAILRTFAAEPGLECVYPRAQPLEAAAEDSYITAQGLEAP